MKRNFFWCSGDTKLIAFEENPLVNPQSAVQRYDLDKGWQDDPDTFYPGRFPGGEWDPIPADYVKEQIKAMEARRIRDESAPKR